MWFFQVKLVVTSVKIYSNFFPGNNNPFLSILCLCESRFLKKNINFSSVKSLYLFQSGQTNGIDIWALAPDIDFTDEAVVHCDVPVAKMLF